MERVEKPAAGNPGLSLHHLSAMRLTPVQLLDEAHRSGCQHVCLFVYVPLAVRNRYPIVDRADIDQLQAAMQRTGISVFNVEVLPLFPETDVLTFAEAFELAQSLGASQATVHVHQPDPKQAIVRLRELARVADDHGLTLGLEFNAFSSVQTPAQALEMLIETGAANLTIVADMLHFVRSGSGLAEAKAIAPYVSYGQLCDGPAIMSEESKWREALSERLPPGEGDFPLSLLISNLSNVRVWDVEVPQRPALEHGQALSDRIDCVVTAARCSLSQAAEQGVSFERH